jgi:hypothetical protein
MDTDGRNREKEFADGAGAGDEQIAGLPLEASAPPGAESGDYESPQVQPPAAPGSRVVAGPTLFQEPPLTPAAEAVKPFSAIELAAISGGKLLTEKLISLEEARQYLPGLSAKQIQRRAYAWNHGPVLESIHFSRVLFTSVEACGRFLAACEQRDLISMTVAASLFPGLPITAGNLRAWARAGTSGRRLKAVKIGKTWYTKRVWVLNFLVEISDPSVEDVQRAARLLRRIGYALDEPARSFAEQLRDRGQSRRKDDDA